MKINSILIISLLFLFFSCNIDRRNEVIRETKQFIEQNKEGIINLFSNSANPNQSEFPSATTTPSPKIDLDQLKILEEKLLELKKSDLSDKNSLIYFHNEGTLRIFSAILNLLQAQQEQSQPQGQSTSQSQGGSQKQENPTGNFQQIAADNIVQATKCYHETARILYYHEPSLSTEHLNAIRLNGELAHLLFELLNQDKQEEEQENQQNEDSQEDDKSEESERQENQDQQKNEGQENSQNENQQQNQESSQQEQQQGNQSLSQEMLEEMQQRFIEQEEQDENSDSEAQSQPEKSQQQQDQEISPELLQALMEEQLRKEEEAKNIPTQGGQYHVEKDW